MAGGREGCASEARPRSTPPPPPPPPPNQVAIVAERGDAYVARLFFGSPAEGAPAAWELAARPSDATWLALQAGCPLFVRRDLFERRAAPMETLMAMVEVAAAGGAGGGEARGGNGSDDDDDREAGAGPPDDPLAPPEPPPAAIEHVVSLKAGDPEPVVLLKRALAVAVREQDYATAATLRDSPLMRAYGALEAARDRGDAGAAATAAAELDWLVSGRPPPAPPPPPPRKAAPRRRKRGGGPAAAGR